MQTAEVMTNAGTTTKQHNKQKQTKNPTIFSSLLHSSAVLALPLAAIPLF
jgi:hypothetical protein